MSSKTTVAGYEKWSLPAVLVLASLPVWGLQVGTGGTSTIDYLRNRGSKGYRFAIYDQITLENDTVDVRTPVEDLARIRDVLHPAVTDLANAFSVSRQAIYDWQSGKSIASENANRLADLARAADLFFQEGLTTTPQLLRRPIFEGKNLFEIIHSGGSAEKAAHTLIKIVQRENFQREALKALLTHRAKPTRDAYEDLGTPTLDEKG